MRKKASFIFCSKNIYKNSNENHFHYSRRNVSIIGNSGKLLFVTYWSQNSKIKKISPLKNLLNFLKVLTMKLPIFKNKRTPHSKILIKVHRYLAVRLQIERHLMKKIKIFTVCVTRKITPIFGYITWSKPVARLLYYINISFKTIASKEIYVLLHLVWCFVLFVRILDRVLRVVSFKSTTQTWLKQPHYLKRPVHVNVPLI